MNDNKLAVAAGTEANGRWTAARANEWYDKQPWLVGANYVPAHASNQIEMWQKETFNPEQIDKELALAKGLGMNTMRVFLHDLVWEQDPDGYKARIDQFLDIAKKHNIKPLIVLFDSVWNPDPKTGAQPEPTAGVHNAGWVQGPGAAALADPAQRARLERYVTGVVSAFGNDDRVLGWDVWNEPDNTNGASYGAKEPTNKLDLVASLLTDVFKWTRAANPVQPLTSGVWIGEWDDISKINEVQKIQLAESDVISFHNYAPADDFERRMKYLQLHDRPLMLTEYMARTVGSTFEAILPVAKTHKVACYNWGFVQGRTQTHLPWDSWSNAYKDEPKQWFHEIFRADHTPYVPSEVKFIKDIIAAPEASLRKQPGPVA
ncbi:MAG TPA: cellulase family glycosylhydrolase [Patescibacteria group bacterium]|nr:cellulase family glycosylhydrolase [Patescibacteria group bacterium]